MRIVRTVLLVPALLLLLSVQSSAATIFLHANLTNAQEGNLVLTTSTGGPRPASFGTADFVLDTVALTMTFTATIFNIDVTGQQTPNDSNDNLVNAHIHAGANLPPLTNGVVWGFFGAPFNDNNPDDHTVMAFTTGVGGTFSGKWDNNEGNLVNGVPTTLSAQIPNILAGRSYINFHTNQFTGGEIRGQILVPEPTTLALLGLGLAGLAARKRKK